MDLDVADGADLVALGVLHDAGLADCPEKEDIFFQTFTYRGSDCSTAVEHRPNKNKLWVRILLGAECFFNSFYPLSIMPLNSPFVDKTL